MILRTDFRPSGDQEPEGNPWNIMVSFYPRTFALHLDAMQRYTDALSEGGSAQEVSARIQQRIATELWVCSTLCGRNARPARWKGCCPGHIQLGTSACRR